MRLPLSLLLWCLAVGNALALPPAVDKAERQRIDAERAEVEKVFAEREAECRQRFVVTSCLDAVRREKREAVERLRQQIVVLDEAQRKQRAAERIEEIRSKISADEAKRREAQARFRAREARLQEQAERAAEAASSASAVAAPAAAAPSRSQRTAPLAATPPKPPAEGASAYEKRQADAKAHRAAVERRNAERAAKSKPSKPLPDPSAASTAGR
jgi:colicin import membrane protein